MERFAIPMTTAFPEIARTTSAALREKPAANMILNAVQGINAVLRIIIA